VRGAALRRFSSLLVGLTVLILAGLGIVTSQNAPQSLDVTPTAAPEAHVLFDDFNYSAQDDPALSDNGWIVRTADGWPGVPGAIWRAEDVTFADDPDTEGNRLVQMTSSVENGKTYQTQVCQQRKFYAGTYATRLHFSDAPAAGPDGDNVVETFYLISPQKYDMDPDYSELDFEYLPNGGWGVPNHVFSMTTWETFQLDPWIADNASDSHNDSYEGWHTLVLQIVYGEATYYVDGKMVSQHGGKYYPEVPMSINYNLWFINGGQLPSTKARDYGEQVDWAYFVADIPLTPDEIESQVANFRDKSVTFTDSVPDWTPRLESPCNF
jgi:glycosyl hydrolase family 16